MKIELRLFASLRKYNEGIGLNWISLHEESTVQDLFTVLKVDPKEVLLIMVNGVHSEPDQILHEGDRVGLFPPVGGG